jgi:hypothetical protein
MQQKSREMKTLEEDPGSRERKKVWFVCKLGWYHSEGSGRI